MSGKRLVKLKERWKDSAGEAVQDVAGALEFGEALLFFAKFAGMGDHTAAGAASWMLDVQHFVKQNVFHGASRNARAVHAAIQQNLVGPGIVTPELPAPASRAPTNVRPPQLPVKVFSIEIVEKSVQIEVFPARIGGGQANPSAPHAIHAA